MKFPQNFLAGAGVLTAGAGGEITGVCTALPAIRANGHISAESQTKKSVHYYGHSKRVYKTSLKTPYIYSCTGCPKKQNHEITELCI